MQRTAYGRVELLVEVEDTGIGIAPEQRGAIFERFSQIDPSNTRRHGGTGHRSGAVAQGSPSRWAAAIDFESEPQRGSIFRLRLPFRTAPTSSGDRPVVQALMAE